MWRVARAWSCTRWQEGCDAYDIAAGLFGAVADGEVAGALYFAEGIDAASHLFAALCGLDEFAREPQAGASLLREGDSLAAGDLAQRGRAQG